MDLVLHIVIYIGEALYCNRGKEAAAKHDETRRNTTKRDEATKRRNDETTKRRKQPSIKEGRED